MSYHNGSVWPHDNAIIAAGFARYGYRREVAQIFTGLFEASNYLDLRRLPELFCGFARQRTQGPTFYPVACSPQAWAAASPLSLLHSCLGMHFEPGKNRIAFERPMLPEFMDELTIQGLSIGSGSTDVAFRRSGDQVVVEVLERRGPVRVLIDA
jgi:glycogen debranching enzyme